TRTVPSTHPTMSIEYIDEVIYHEPIDFTHNLRLVVARIDRPEWVVKCDYRSLFVSLRDPPSPIILKKEKKSLVKSLKEKVSRHKQVADRPTLQDFCLSPYSVHVSAHRGNRGKVEELGQWSFSGQLAPGHTFHIRTDGILESFHDGAPSDVVLTVRVRSKRSLRLENLNTAQTVLDIGENCYEFVSKEILALSSPFFNAFFYGGFMESGMSGPIKMRPLLGENPRDYEEGMSLLLGYVHHGDLDRVNAFNVHHMLNMAERYRVNGINRKIEKYLIQYCEENPSTANWEAAIIAADEFQLNIVSDKVIPMYRKPEQVWELQSRLKGKMTMKLAEMLFSILKLRVNDATLVRTCHLYFQFHEGNVIVQLNRARLPKTISRLVDHFSGVKYDAPHFYWNDKNRLISAEPAPNSLWNGEDASKKTVPDDSWALVLKKGSDHRSRLMLAKDRPDGVYLGFVVTRASLLRGERCLATGLHKFEV
ncbi:hypothetical protein PFISCL1PPCAC_9949, partial [Pristionchus fissidentatus]